MRILNKELLSQYRLPGNCQNCGLSCKQREGHHLLSRGAGGSDIDINLIALGASVPYPQCPCHGGFHARGEPSGEELRVIVAKREKTTPEDILDVCWLIRRLPRNASQALIAVGIGNLPASAQVLAKKVLGDAGVLK